MPSTLTEKRECETTHWLLEVECSGDVEFVQIAHGRRKYLCRAAAHAFFKQGRTRCYDCKYPRATHWAYEAVNA